jgi:hypothetical protein
MEGVTMTKSKRPKITIKGDTAGLDSVHVLAPVGQRQASYELVAKLLPALAELDELLCLSDPAQGGITHEP